MGKPTGFMEFSRKTAPTRDPLVRLSDWHEIYDSADEKVLKRQSARCMDCGVPFCHSNNGCPIDNLIPEWNDLVYHGRWRAAWERLKATNNFPEFTGRICPAPCESACVLGIHEEPVSIKTIECAIIDHAFEAGWEIPQPPLKRTGKKIAIIGSGPAGLAAAEQLNKAGHNITVFERDDRIGGLLTYGVPNMKLDKAVIQRRIDLLTANGIIFRTNCNVGGGLSDHGEAKDAEIIDPQQLLKDYDAILLATGALKARTLDIAGSDLNGVLRAMTFLHQTTRSLLDSGLRDNSHLSAKNKNVIVIGGGDTGTDCIGTALRQGCKSVINITRREKEPDSRDSWHPWPGATGTYYIDYGHAEGIARDGRDPREYGVQPLEFIGENGQVTGIRIARLKWTTDSKTGKKTSEQISEEVIPADLVLLSMGFVGTDSPELFKQLNIEQQRGNAKANSNDYKTSNDKVFAAGDARRGASLVVWAIAEGRRAAYAIDKELTGNSVLPYPD